MRSWGVWGEGVRGRILGIGDRRCGADLFSSTSSIVGQRALFEAMRAVLLERERDGEEEEGRLSLALMLAWLSGLACSLGE